MFLVPERYRMTTGEYASTAEYGNNGAFKVPLGTRYASVIASDGAGWEHVSVSFHDRCPTWTEMCEIKDLFWGAEDWVVQYHPAQSDYISYHPYCLHLWRPIGVDLPKPSIWMVGPKARKLKQ